MPLPQHILDGIPARVAAGATFLDATLPGWSDRVDLPTLQLNSCTECVIGQLYGGWGTGWWASGLSESVVGSTALGFNARSGEYVLLNWREYDATLQAEFAALTAAWKALILARRAAAPAPRELEVCR